MEQYQNKLKSCVYTRNWARVLQIWRVESIHNMFELWERKWEVSSSSLLRKKEETSLFRKFSPDRDRQQCICKKDSKNIATYFFLLLLILLSYLVGIYFQIMNEEGGRGKCTTLNYWDSGCCWLLLVKDSSHTHAAASLLLALRCKNFYVHKYLLW